MMGKLSIFRSSKKEKKQYNENGDVLPTGPYLSINDNLDKLYEMSSFLREPPPDADQVIAAAPLERDELHLDANDKGLALGPYYRAYSVMRICLKQKHSNESHSERQAIADNSLAQDAGYYSLKCIDKKSFKKMHKEKDSKPFVQAMTNLIIEAIVLNKLSHPHILQLKGRTDDSFLSLFTSESYQVHHDTFFLATDRIQETLSDRLEAWRDEQSEDRDSHPVNPEWPFFDVKLQYAQEMASALEYLHDRQIMVLGLNPSCIGFLANSGRLQLCDIGTCRQVPSKPQKTKNSNNNNDNDPAFAEDDIGDGEKFVNPTDGSTHDPLMVPLIELGTVPRYMAPELVAHGQVSLQADVYSWAIIVLEMLTLQIPYTQFKGGRFLIEVCLAGNRPNLLLYKDMPPMLEAILKRCWRGTVEKRLSSAEIVQAMERLRDKLYGGGISAHISGTGGGVNKRLTASSTVSSAESTDDSIFGTDVSCRNDLEMAPQQRASLDRKASVVKRKDKHLRSSKASSRSLEKGKSMGGIVMGTTSRRREKNLRSSEAPITNDIDNGLIPPTSLERGVSMGGLPSGSVTRRDKGRSEDNNDDVLPPPSLDSGVSGGSVKKKDKQRPLKKGVSTRGLESGKKKDKDRRREKRTKKGGEQIPKRGLPHRMGSQSMRVITSSWDLPERPVLRKSNSFNEKTSSHSTNRDSTTTTLTPVSLTNNNQGDPNAAAAAAAAAPTRSTPTRSSSGVKLSSRRKGPGRHSSSNKVKKDERRRSKRTQQPKGRGLPSKMGSQSMRNVFSSSTDTHPMIRTLRKAHSSSDLLKNQPTADPPGSDPPGMSFDRQGIAGAAVPGVAVAAEKTEQAQSATNDEAKKDETKSRRKLPKKTRSSKGGKREGEPRRRKKKEGNPEQAFTSLDMSSSSFGIGADAPKIEKKPSSKTDLNSSMELSGMSIMDGSNKGDGPRRRSSARAAELDSSNIGSSRKEGSKRRSRRSGQDSSSKLDFSASNLHVSGVAEKGEEKNRRQRHSEKERADPVPGTIETDDSEYVGEAEGHGDGNAPARISASSRAADAGGVLVEEAADSFFGVGENEQ